MKSADVTLIFAKWWMWLPFLVHLTGDEQSKKGKTEGSLGELFASVRLMIYYAWMELEFFASGQSNKPEPKPRHFLLAGGLENKVVMGWC